jgi:DNA modification methylase
MIHLINADCNDYLKSMTGSVRCMIADIPDNEGYKYDGFVDRREDYREWLETMLFRASTRCEVFWLSFSQNNDYLVKSITMRLRYRWQYHKQIVWTYTFGQYQDKSLGQNYRPLLLMARENDLNYDRIRVISSRMRDGDKRAAGPRVPSDVWEYSQIVGNNLERVPWHCTQTPYDMMRRMVVMTCHKPDHKLVDLCVGSGTSLRVAKHFNVDATGVEISQPYFQKLCLDFPDAQF